MFSAWASTALVCRLAFKKASSAECPTVQDPASATGRDNCSMSTLLAHGAKLDATALDAARRRLTKALSASPEGGSFLLTPLSKRGFRCEHLATPNALAHNCWAASNVAATSRSGKSMQTRRNDSSLASLHRPILSLNCRAVLLNVCSSPEELTPTAAYATKAS